LGLRQAVEEGQVVLGRAEDGSAVIASVEGVVDETISDRTGLAWHRSSLPGRAEFVKRKMN
jgi:hypothetical protein